MKKAIVVVAVFTAMAAFAGARVFLKRADAKGYTVQGDANKIYRVEVTHFDGGGRCRAWLQGGGTKMDLNGAGVYVEVAGGTRISILTCDECKPSTNSCKDGSPIGEWPVTAGDGATVAQATWEIGAGIRGVGQATAKANEAD